MQYGTDTLSIIEQHLSAARNQTRASSSRLEALNRRLVDLRADLGEAVRRLARFRMNELKADRIIAHLDETDREVVDLLSQRAAALRETEQNLAESLKHQEALKASRDEAARAVDETLKALDDGAAEVKAQLGRQESYSAQEARAADAAERLSRASEKADQAEADRAAKGKPYEDDPLFMYLWKRGFLSPEYKAGPLTRALDARVARMIRFDETRNN
jgi:DNA repair exonuclease SbcCD ATPase subunit